MTRPARPVGSLLDPEEVKTRLINTAATSFSLGLITGLLSYHFLAQPAVAVEPPRTVPALMLKVGQKLCEDWSGLKNIMRVNKDNYTFTCEKYAEFKDLEVR